MITASLVLNLAVLIPVCLSLLANAGWTVSAYGEPSPARGFLLSIYLAILLVSAALLLKPITMMVAALLIVQVVYKLTTPFTVGSLSNPVVVSNLLIAAVHLITLWVIFRSTASQA